MRTEGRFPTMMMMREDDQIKELTTLFLNSAFNLAQNREERRGIVPDDCMITMTLSIKQNEEEHIDTYIFCFLP